MLRKLIERPIAVTMFLIMVLVLGLVSIGLLPISLIPSVDIPYITVQVSYSEYSAREMEDAVVSPLRHQLMQIAGLKEIQSETKDGSGTITMNFKHGSRSDYLFIEVNEKIDRSMGRLPEGMERPYVLKAGAGDIPAFYINLTIKNDEDFIPPNEFYSVSDRFMELSDFAGNVIVKRIEQLPEVAMVDANGYINREILLIPDQAKLKQMNVTASALESALRSLNISLGNITIRDGEYQFNVKVQRNAQNVTDIENAYVKINGRVFQIKDLARVIEHPGKRMTYVKSDGRNAVTLAVIKQSDARMSKLKKGINDLLVHFQKDYPEVEFTVTRDQTELLDYSIKSLFQNIILGILLACIIIFIFIRNLRSSLLIAISIPAALILSMLFFYIIGISINIISLSGLVLGVGMMVDNSIIVIDSINFRWKNGYSLKEAILKGTGEVFMPMLSSVLTTCAVFVPLIFISGIAGALFYDQAMAVVITLFCALAVTVTVIPVYFYLVYRNKDSMVSNTHLQKLNGRWFMDGYEKILKFLFRRRWLVWMFFLITMAGTVILFGIIQKERLPEMAYDDMLVHINWNERITVEENDRRVGELVKAVVEMTDQVTEMTGPQQFMLSHSTATGTSESLLYLNTNKKFTVEEVQAVISQFITGNYPETVYGFQSSGNIFEVVFAEQEAKLVARLRPTTSQSPEPLKLNSILSEIAAKIYPLEVKPVIWEDYVIFVGNTEMMTLYDVTFSELNSILRNSINENTIFNLMQGKFSIPVIVGENKKNLTDIFQGSYIRKAGTDIPISSFFRETRGQDLKYIISGAEGNYYPLEFDLQDKYVNMTMEEIREVVRGNEDFEVTFSGSYFSSREMVKEIMTVMIIAILLLYFILAAQFESLVQPFIILSELIIDICLTLLVLWLLDISLNIMSMIGLIVTCGIVINDSILKVDTINQLRKYEGVSVLRAIMEGGRRRIKPIIMTSLTTILAVTPFLAKGDMGSYLQYPLSVAIIAGMTVGTVVSIFIIPIVYYSIYRKN